MTRDIEKAFARTFSTPSGEVVLNELKEITLHRVLGPDASNEALRFLEGERFLVRYIENFIKRGKQ